MAFLAGLAVFGGWQRIGFALCVLGVALVLVTGADPHLDYGG